jgi:GH25 family lysozyme M1 (1,4-beta-N-acetylmuramidase)
MTDIYMADISEFQTNIDAPTYLKNHQCVICRVHNGDRPDHMMPVRMNYLREQPFAGIGWYQYLATDRDPAAQAHDFISLVGHLRTNEWPILDLEVGNGDQTARAQAWFNVVDEWANLSATLYSGLSFLNSNLGGAGHWTGRPIWVAAYGQNEPGVPHSLWQFSESWQCPGVTPGQCDGSVHHGTTPAQFVSDMRHAKGG